MNPLISRINNVTRKESKSWFNVICKYYGGNAIRVKTDQKYVTHGRVSQNFFDNELKSGDMYDMTVDNRSAEMSFIRTLPLFKIDDWVISENIISTRSVKQRIVYTNRYQTKINLDEKINSILNRRKETIINETTRCLEFLDIVSILPYLEHKEFITRIYVSLTQQIIFLVLHDEIIMVISPHGSYHSDVHMFEIKHGYFFEHEGALQSEFNEMFIKWQRKFTYTNGDSWNDPILGLDESIC